MEHNRKSTNRVAETRIYDATRNCLHKFRDLIESDQLQNHQNIEILEQRLQVWASYSGATSRPALSLDSRLEVLVDIKMAVLGLLGMISTHLDKVSLAPDIKLRDIDPEHEARLQPTPSLFDKNALAEIENLSQEKRWQSYTGSTWEAIEKAIDMLLEIASVVRDASTQSRGSYAPADYRRQDDAYFDELLQVLARLQFPNARPSLTEQVARSVFVRRRRILWHQNHAAKLALPRSAPDQMPSRSQTPADGSLSVQQKMIRPELQKHDVNRRLMHPAGSPLSSTNLSRPHGSSVIMRRLKTPTIVSGRTRGAVIQDKLIFAYPDPPLALNEQHYTICPYCNKPLPRMMTGDLWKQHVDKDLQPLVCISEKCQDTLQFFSSKTQWTEHMVENHGQDWYRDIHMKTWFCDINHTESLEFTSVESFRNHLTSHRLSNIRRSAMVRHNHGRGQRDLGTCPFCEHKPIAKPSEVPSSKSLTSLNDHIASHLSNIALLALPAADKVILDGLEDNSVNAEIATSSNSDRLIQHSSDYSIVIVTSLPIERVAVIAMFDERHATPQDFRQNISDSTLYSWGKIAEHNVVVALPAWEKENVSTKINILASTIEVKFGLSVGTGSGVPSTYHDVRLGDVVISQPTRCSNGVVHHDLGKAKSGNQYKLIRPPTLSTEASQRAVIALQDLGERTVFRVNETLTSAGDQSTEEPENFDYPGSYQDSLFLSSYDHVDKNDQLCAKCDIGKQIRRDPRNSTMPYVHYGTIGTVNAAIQNTKVRDDIAKSIGEDCICLATANEVSTDHFPGIFVCGICDYADSHKNKLWQQYAAATAAAYAKELLMHISPIDVSKFPVATESIKVSAEEELAMNLRLARFIAAESQQQASHLIEALYTTQYVEHKDRNFKRLPGTCEWFLQHTSFAQWRSSPTSSVLWVSGDPGCGKSVLARYLIDEVLANSASQSSIMVCYFFFQDEFMDQGAATDALCALLHQLLTQNSDLVPQESLERFILRGTELLCSFRDLWTFFRSVLDNVKNCEVICVLDAVDEGLNKDMRNLLSALDALVRFDNSVSSNSVIRFLITTRPYSGVVNSLNFKSTVVHLTGESEEEASMISSEIDLVITARMERLRNQKQLSQDEAEFILARLKELPHRTYLWVHLILSDLENTISPSKNARELLLDYPYTINETYEKFLAESADQERCYLLLQIVIASMRPLSIVELSVLLAVRESYIQSGSLLDDMMSEESCLISIRKLTRSLVNNVGPHVHLVHSTLKEFLMAGSIERQSFDHRPPGHPWKGSVQLPAANSLLAERCLWYLCLSESQQDPDKVLYNYSLRNWVIHFRESKAHYQARTTALVATFCMEQSKPVYKEWLGSGSELMSSKLESGIWEELERNLESELCPFWLVVPILFGIPIVIKYIFSQLENVFTVTEISHGLLLISRKKNECKSIAGTDEDDLEIANLLISEGASPDYWSGNASPLFEAILFGKIQLAKMFLTYGTYNEHRNADGETVLHCAAGSHSIEIIETLVQSGASILEKDNFGRIPLVAFVRNHYGCKDLDTRKTFDSLINKQVSMNDLYIDQDTPGSVQVTVLHLSALGNCVPCVEQSLYNGADVDIGDTQGRTILHIAAEKNLPSILSMALKNGAKIDKADNDGYTALMMAAKNTSIACSQILLNHRADLNVTQSDGSTALLLACGCSDEDTVSLVESYLDHGASPHTYDANGATPLHLAAGIANSVLCELLIQAGASVDHPNLDGQTPLISLFYSSMNRGFWDGGPFFEDIVKTTEVLLKRGADLKVKDHGDQTALDYFNKIGWDHSEVEDAGALTMLIQEYSAMSRNELEA